MSEDLEKYFDAEELEYQIQVRLNFLKSQNLENGLYVLKSTDGTYLTGDKRCRFKASKKDAIGFELWDLIKEDYRLECLEYEECLLIEPHWTDTNVL